MHINDLRTPCEMIKYVDDSTVYEICTVNSASVLQESATIVVKWSKENDMRINNSKTKEIVISFGKGTVESIPNIVIDECDIERVDHTKVLGVTVSSDLTWNMHISGRIPRVDWRGGGVVNWLGIGGDARHRRSVDLEGSGGMLLQKFCYKFD